MRMRKRDDPIDCTEPAASHAEPANAYGRWSRRKARARAAPAPAAPRAQPPASAAVPAAAADGAGHAPDAPPERALTDADMPALEALGEDDDYSGFLSPGVSEQLRLKALRKLFTSAKFNVTDGLDDYAEDFTKFEPLGDIITSDMRHRIEMEAERARLAAEDEAREALARDAAARPEAALEDAAYGAKSDTPGAPDQSRAQEAARGGDSGTPGAPEQSRAQEAARGGDGSTPGTPEQAGAQDTTRDGDAAAPPAARAADPAPVPPAPFDAPGSGPAAAAPRARQQRDDG